MGRGDLIRRFLIVAVLAAAAASTAAAAIGIPWKVIVAGETESAGAQGPTAYIATTRDQERRFAARLSTADRAALSHQSLAATAVVAVFLDGLPCARDVAVSRVVRTTTGLTVSVAFTRPPIGMAMCVRRGTAYFVLGVPRRDVAITTAPAKVKVVAVARS
jgi:hypothetical protein